jgi:hypothetical protein
MDYDAIIASSGLSSVLVMTGYVIYKIFRHSRCKSNCCGKRMTLDIDLEESLLKKSTSRENEMDGGAQSV